MPKIVCDVTKCSHNKSNICYANRINIAGGNAENSEQTNCASFLDKNHYSTLTNNTNYDSDECNAIVCNVHSCSYNHNKCCYADSIQVTGDGANLYEETSCHTFKPE